MWVSEAEDTTGISENFCWPESMVLPLQQFKASDFNDQEEWQKRNIKMLEADLLPHGDGGGKAIIREMQLMMLKEGAIANLINVWIKTCRRNGLIKIFNKRFGIHQLIKRAVPLQLWRFCE